MEQEETNATNSVIESYIDFILSGKHPRNVYKFCKEAKMTEKEFYSEFSTLNAVRKKLFALPMEQTLEILEKDEAYLEYSVHEKILSLYYTWVQQLTSYRSIILHFEEESKLKFYKEFYDSFYPLFKEHVDQLIMEGVAKNEFPSRQFVDQFYTKGLWTQLMFIFKFWLQDDSKGFEKTDAAIEKSAKVAFDMMGHGPIDAILDFGRFMIGNMRP